MMRQMEPDASSVTRSEPSRATVTPTADPKRWPLSTTKPVMKSSYSPDAEKLFFRGKPRDYDALKRCRFGPVIALEQIQRVLAHTSNSLTRLLGVAFHQVFH
jgi:hypothetical protein